MSEDMSNTNDAHQAYTNVIPAQLGERVTKSRPPTARSGNRVPSGFENIDTAVTSLANETRASIPRCRKTLPSATSLNGRRLMLR